MKLPKLEMDRDNSILSQFQSTERLQWRLWIVATLVTFLLTSGIALIVLVVRMRGLKGFELGHAISGLSALILLFDLYVVYQQFQIMRVHKWLVEREQLFWLITENTEDMITVADSSGTRIYSSPSYQRTLGYGPEELVHKSILSQVHPDDQEHVKRMLDELVAMGVGKRIEYRMQHKDGGWRLVESTASAVFDNAKKVKKVVIVKREISTRRRLEEQLRQVQKMDAVGRLSGGIAHDFNNLLGVIIGYTESILEKLPPENPLHLQAEEVLAAGKRAGALTRQLLAFSRQQVLETKIFDVNSAVANMEKMLRRLIGEDIELTTILHGNAGNIRGDQTQLEQVIMNLAVNARDAMPGGGQLSIRTSVVEIGEEFTQQYSYPILAGSYVHLSVSDSGSGMDRATQMRAFDPFFTTKEKGKGTGLGLSVVYGVVKQSGGYIDIVSESGKGTTFNIYLPRVANAVPEQPVIAAQKFSPGSETILLVEDDEALRRLTRSTLTECGYKVLEADHPNAAMAVSKGYEGTIHLLLSDVVMPKMNGKMLADELLRHRPAMIVIYMSGHTGQTFAKTVLPADSIFLQKPFSREDLTSCVRKSLDAPQAKEASLG